MVPKDIVQIIQIFQDPSRASMTLPCPWTSVMEPPAVGDFIWIDRGDNWGEEWCIQALGADFNNEYMINMMCAQSTISIVVVEGDQNISSSTVSNISLSTLYIILIWLHRIPLQFLLFLLKYAYINISRNSTLSAFRRAVCQCNRLHGRDLQWHWLVHGEDAISSSPFIPNEHRASWLALHWWFCAGYGSWTILAKAKDCQESQHGREYWDSHITQWCESSMTSSAIFDSQSLLWQLTNMSKSLRDLWRALWDMSSPRTMSKIILLLVLSLKMNFEGDKLVYL